MPTAPALQVVGLVKDVGPVPALDGRMKRVVSDVSLTANFGEVTVLLGSNGAGKTTTLECVQGLTSRQGGTVTLLGQDPEHADAELRARVGVMLQDGGLPPAMRPLALLHHVAGMYRNPWPVEDLAQLLQLNDFDRTTIRRLSGGQRQRVALAAALLGRPEIVFLDEPSAGLDPQSRQLVLDLIRRLRDEGMAIVLTTHLLDDAQRLADQVYIIDQGRTVAQGTVPDLLAAAARSEETRTLSFDLPSTPNETAAVLAAMRRSGLRLEEPQPGHFTLQGKIGPHDLAELTSWWLAEGLMPTSLALSEPTLEEVFLQIATHRSPEGPGSDPNASMDPQGAS
ncbi:ABC transporter ATP-binding protein [Psychromicrobium xiongbiense]|uniref:ABC transporter ATP-binding protein n=1 Tax=Psychromicrobium xiongbiense TaxID=3051184 RepID=UPI0025538B90|nr:ABC transporter ATP-binding protein [Psychromicrobium sp. YIM S02556]